MTTSVPTKTIEPFMLGIGLLFLVVFMINAAFVYYALETFTGVVTDQAYDKGLAFNATIQAQRQQDALGWQGEAMVNLYTGQPGTIQFILRDRAGQPLPGMQVSGLLFRPVQAGLDQTVILNEMQPGLYQGVATVPQPGQWELRIEARSAAGLFRSVQRLYIPLGVYSK